MRVKIPESARERKRSFGSTAVSTLLHTLLIGGSVVATGLGTEHLAQPDKPEQVTTIYREPQRSPDPPPSARRMPQIPTNVETPVVPPTVPAISSVVSSELPPPTATIGTVNADAFSRAPVDTTPATNGSGETSSAPYAEFAVEKAVAPLRGNQPPRYPTMLASAGLEGSVYAQFVVDTLGRVEPESFRAVRSDHPLFERAVRDALNRMRFSPAEVGGRRVRQLVEQGFSFALDKR